MERLESEKVDSARNKAGRLSYLDQREYDQMEEQISAARRAYNQAVTDYNNAIEMIPTSFMASLMHYGRKQVFEIDVSERQNVNVKELFS